jgi:hypothetical protein
MEIEELVPEHLAKSTKQCYVKTLKRFVNDFLNKSMTIEEVLAEARRDATKTQQRIDAFYKWLREKPTIRESSAYVLAYGYLRGFFTNNDIAFQRKWSKSHAKKDTESESIIHDDKNYSFFTADEETQTVQFNSDAMRNFLANLSLRDQAITLALLSSGQDSGDLFNLNIGDVKQQTKNGRIYWASKRNKTAIPFKTFISREATKLTCRYVEQERVGAKDGDPLFVFTTRKKDQEKATEERMTSDYLGWVYRDVARKMKIEWKEDEANPLRPKRMRHLFRTACDTAGLQEIYANAFMGHKNHMGMKYSEIAPAILEVQYMRVEPYLTVFSATGSEYQKTREEITNLKTTVDVLNKRLEEQRKTLDSLQAVMDKRVEEITRKLVEKWLKETYEEWNKASQPKTDQ